MACATLPSGDSKLVQIVDLALADTARKSGAWLVCREGCTQCCVGVFSISQLDAARLRQGMAEMQASNPNGVDRIRERARESVARLALTFPGDVVSGILDDSDAAEERFLSFGNDEVCPALSPESGRCELYAHRPMTCRVFGPPVRSESEDGLAVCELCYHGASNEEIAACEMHPDPDNIETGLIEEIEKASGIKGNTIVAYCLAQ